MEESIQNYEKEIEKLNVKTDGQYNQIEDLTNQMKELTLLNEELSTKFKDLDRQVAEKDGPRKIFENKHIQTKNKRSNKEV